MKYSRNKKIIAYLLAISFTITFNCCKSKEAEKGSGFSFTSIPSSQSGITFTNTITENDSVNLVTNEYAYTGGGVGIGDFNNDNLPDIFFTGNQVSSKLYLNEGSFSFKDITENAGLSTNYWATGVSIVDINNDGFDDIYVCASGSTNAAERRNRLYINEGNLTFTEQAKAYGLADTNFSTQAAFLDFDGDGDLDMYLVNHLLYTQNANTVLPPDFSGASPAADKLYCNKGFQKSLGHPVFTDVSINAGIKESGYGLGLVVSDFNGDNRPDIYVANDYVANDILWLNRGDGTFNNVIASSVKHQSYSSMGVDAADMNNDGLPDIITLDMLPADNVRRKMMFSFMNNDRYALERQMGYEPSFMRNMLQLNNGNRYAGNTSEPFFSEVGQLAGIEATDWSWSVLMADFDNDGWKDIHITNGMGKDMLNSDYLYYRNNMALSGQYSNEVERTKAEAKKLDGYGDVKLRNYLFKNERNLRFSNISADAGIGDAAISNGAAYADLDNDGDLDLIINNINSAAFLLRNDVASANLNNSNYINVVLKGNSFNKNGFGAKVKMYVDDKVMFAAQNPVRGFFSTVDKRLHFGVGRATAIDSIIVTWPDNRQQTLYKVAVNKTLELYQKDATAMRSETTEKSTLFESVAEEKGILYKHKETYFSDFDFQRLLPQKYSQLGPFIAEGDINGDGLTDIFVGGAYDQSGQFFIQGKNGAFVSKDLVKGEKNEEDLGCLLFDADGDNDLDLFVNSGGYEYDAGSAYYKPRLYINNGKGEFSIRKNAFPNTINTSAQCVAGADYDGDGDVDLFIGGRVSPNNYPVAPNSYILQNNEGMFTDVTKSVNASLQQIGMVTAAVWTDFNNDNKPDLIITGEWMAVRFFKNDDKKLTEVTANTGLVNMRGQWRSLASSDLDDDGDMDFVAGNLGLNNKYGATVKTPMKLFAADLDGNGSIDPIFCYYISDEKGERKLYPAIGRDALAEQVPSIKKDFLLHKDYSLKTATEILKGMNTANMIELTCEETRSCWIENKGKGQFEMHPLLIEAQIAPINAIVCTDADGDGLTDILLAGNEYGAEVTTGRYDATYGLLLKGKGKGGFASVGFGQSGFIVDGDVKDMKLIANGNGEKFLIIAVNNDTVKVMKLK